MSSRALRRLQKEQEEQKAAQQAEEQVESEGEVELDTKPAAKKSAFALLNENEEGDEGEEEDAVTVTKS